MATSSSAASTAAAPHPSPRTRGRGDREGPTLGAGGGVEGPVRRGGRRPGTLSTRHPPRGCRVPDREDVPGLAARGLLDPGTDPAGAAHPGMGPPAGEPRCVRAVGHREDVPTGSARSSGGRGRPEGRLVHLGRPRACCSGDTVPTTPCPRRSLGSCAPTWSSSTTSGSSRWGRTPPKASTGSSMPSYEKRSVAVSSNLHPSGFDELMPKTHVRHWAVPTVP